MKHIVKYAVVLCMLMGMILPVQAFAGCEAAGWTESSTGGDQAAWQTKWNCGNWASCLKTASAEFARKTRIRGTLSSKPVRTTIVNCRRTAQTAVVMPIRIAHTAAVMPPMQI